MKILFFGRGLISTQYAWAFEKEGHIVEFYVREGRKAQLKDYINLEMWDARKPFKAKLVKEKWPITLHEEIKNDNNYDLIIVSVNTEQLPSAVSYLSGRIGNATILFFSNIWAEPNKAVEPLPLKQVIFGFPGGGGGIENNKLRGGFFKIVQIGETKLADKARIDAVKILFKNTGFKVSIQKDMKSWLWNHYAINVAIEMELLKGLTFKELMEKRSNLEKIGLNLKELIPILEERKAKIDITTKLFAYLPSKILGFLLGNVVFAPKSLPRLLMEYNNSKIGYSSYDVLSEAKKLNIAVPRLETSVQYCYK